MVIWPDAIQRPEQHGGGFGAGQHCLRLDPALEFFMQTFMCT